MIEDGAIKEDFQVELLGEYEKEECLKQEAELSKISLFPKGLNGNAGSAIIRTFEGSEKVRDAIIKSSHNRITNGIHHFCNKEFQKEMSKRGLEKQRKNGNIIKWNKKGQDATKNLVSKGLHVFQDRTQQKERAIKRTQEGKNPFQGKTGTIIAQENNKRMLLEGRHPSQIRVSCLKCRKNYSIANFFRHHNGKCEV